MKILNIANASGSVATGWTSTQQLNEDAISQLGDKTADSANAFNAIPSPFSRLHVFETAFKLTTRESRDNQGNLSSNFLDLVSDCLDLLELIFNAKFHESQGNKLSFVKWTSADLEKLPRETEGQRSFAKTIKLFLDQDFGATNDGITMIKYKDMVIGGTSPKTLVFTTPNLDKSQAGFRSPYFEEAFDLINPINQKRYFRKTRSFKERGDAFKAYILHFFSQNTSLKKSARPIWAYLVMENIERLPAHERGKLSSINCSNGGQLTVSGAPLMSNGNEGSMDIFHDYLLKVNYRIDETRFATPAYTEDTLDRNFDFLLPVKEEFLKNLDIEQISTLFTYRLIGTSGVEVIYNGNLPTTTKSKKFRELVLDKNEGKIIDFEQNLELNFSLGIFPFLKVLDETGASHPKYNDFFKVLLALDVSGLSAGKGQLSTSKFGLTFFKIQDGEMEAISADGAQYKAVRFERRKFESPDLLASIYYELNNTCFDFVRLNLPGTHGFVELKGIVIPLWKKKRVGQREFTYSVDFGTTNTFIAYSNDHNRTSTPEPFDIQLNEVQMVMLQKPKAPKGGQSVSASFKNSSTITINDSIINHEFVPPVLIPSDSDSPYKMPFRTAVFQVKNPRAYKLFDDVNIHFSYQKAKIDANTAMNQVIVPNIKWDITDVKNEGAKERVQVFIRELCYLIRYKTLLNDGDPSKTEICWFIPQSLSYDATRQYREIWADAASAVLLSQKQPKLVFESEAPYYFLRKKAAIRDITSVLSLDIGGGSTDAMVFANNQPVLGTSFNFAGNVLWANGYSQLTSDSRENGFYGHLRDRMDEKIKQLNDLTLQQNSLYFNRRSTDEIINFWLSNNDQLKVTEELKQPRFKVVYLIHFSAVLYHILQFLKDNEKTNGKEIASPSCIIFSGNGSKYIDFLGDEAILSKIAGYFVRKIFHPDSKNPQVILPTENRKEATCYGGIFKENDVDFISKSYLGTELIYPASETIKTYNQIDADFSNIKKSVRQNIIHFFKLLKDLNTEVPLRSHLTIDADFEGISHFVDAELNSYFDLGYGNRKEKVDGKEVITDSLFFYPLIGIIFDVAKMEKKQFEQYIPVTFMFCSLPAEEGIFLDKDMQQIAGINSNYKIGYTSSTPGEATFELIESSVVSQRAYLSFDTLIKPVCIVEKFPESAENIQISASNKGRMRKDGDKWIVTEKLKIAFN